jgi:hypothetical protein
VLIKAKAIKIFLCILFILRTSKLIIKIIYQ